MVRLQSDLTLTGAAIYLKYIGFSNLARSMLY